MLLAMPDPVTRLNNALAGRYRVEQRLGEGGMATVYLAEDLRHRRKVALKVLKPELAAIVGAERFLAEIETTAGLQHPHILPLHDSGDADGLLYYVMPRVEGESLRERLDRERQLPVGEAVRIATHVAEALDHAHRRGVIHRDIKPANILLLDGNPVVSDFGIALAVSASGEGRLTETGLSLGTPHYMSPEQATRDHSLGPATDIWALGCVLYEMLASEPPYSGGTPQAVLGKIITAESPSIVATRKTVPPNVDATIRRALEKVPADRFATAQEFSRALANRSFTHGASEDGRPTDGVWRPLAIAASLSALALAGVVAWLAVREEPSMPVARFESPFREGEEPVEFGLNAYDIAPDGSFLVYRGPGPDGDFPQLWIRRWEDPSATPLPGTIGAVSPSISPDGSGVGFRLPPNIIAMPLGGGPARTLAEGFSPEWGDDGYVYYNGVNSSVLRVPVSGGLPDTIAPGGEELGVGLTEILPGGRGALLHRQEQSGTVWNLHALDFRSGELISLWPGQSPTYSPTGHVLGVTDGVLMAAPFDVEALQLLGPPVPVMDSVVRATMSSNGTLVYSKGSADAQGNMELIWVSRSGVATPVEAGWTFTRGGGNAGWSLSPDGTRIALRQLVEDNLDIWVKDLPDGPLRRITFGGNEQRVPFWAPDGSRVTYFSVMEENRGEVWWTRADGAGDPELLLASQAAFAQGAWSPDGAWLVLRVGAVAPAAADPPGARDLFVFRPGIDETPRPLLTSPDYAEADPAFSRDGRWLAYVSNETGRNEVFVRPFPDVGAGKFQVSTNGGASPRWSHGGRHLFYVDEARNMIEVAFEAGSSFRVLERTTLFTMPAAFAPSIAGNNVMDIAPGDDRFLTGRNLTGNLAAASDLSLVLVQNFAEELRRRMPR